MAKKHSCRVKSEQVKGYIAIREGQVVIVPPYIRCPKQK